MKHFRRYLLFFFLLLLQVNGTGFAQPQPVEAQWKVYQVRFRFVGQATHYTCDGIEQTLKRLLRLLGARDDLRVEARCISRNQVERFQRVNMAFALPVPADKSDLSAEIIPAEWRQVRLGGVSSRYLDEGDCELVEQFERQVLPELNVRNDGRKVRCVPYRREFNRINVRMTALMPLDKVELEKDRKEKIMMEKKP